MEKSLEEIVEDLRSKGVLDEDKWLELEKKKKKWGRIIYSMSFFVLALALIKMEPLDILFASFISYYLIVMIFKKSLKEWAILTQLFSTGERHKAFVSHVKEFGWPNSITPVLAIKSTLHINEKEYLNDQNIPLRWIERIDFPKVGTEIDVVYDKYNPSLFRFYNEKLEERFDVKKKINGER